jgi:hypothetical protein
MIETTEKRLNDIVEILLKKNNLDYNKLKASEEFQELALALTQQVLKPNKTKDQEVIDEIGDCIIRLELVKRLYNSEKIDKRVNYKIDNFLEYLEGGKYENI